MMNSTDFAQKIKQKYPVYNNLSDEELTTKMLAKYPQYKSQVQITPEDKITGIPKDILNVTQGIGGFAKNDLGLGLFTDAVSANPVTQNIQKLTGVNPLLNSQTLQQEQQHPVSNAVGDFGSAIATLGGAKIAGMGASKILPFLTKRGVAGVTTKAAEQATQANKMIQWDDLSGQIEKEVRSTLGDTPEVKKALNSLLSEKGLGGIDSLGTGTTRNVMRGGKLVTQLPPNPGNPMSPTQLLQWRRQIQARGGSNLFQKLLKGSDIEGKVAATARRVISQNIHQLAPGTKNADKAYAIYSKLGGSPANLAIKGALMGGLHQTFGKDLGPLEPVIDLLLAGSGVGG